jgi:hypothetical protein
MRCLHVAIIVQESRTVNVAGGKGRDANIMAGPNRRRTTSRLAISTAETSLLIGVVRCRDGAVGSLETVPNGRIITLVHVELLERNGFSSTNMVGHVHCRRPVCNLALMRLVSAFLAIMISLLGRPDRTMAYDLIGVGQWSCVDWAQARPAKQSDVTEQWGLGFLSGVAFMSKNRNDPLRGLPPQALSDWLDRQHPSESIAHGTETFSITQDPARWRSVRRTLSRTDRASVGSVRALLQKAREVHGLVGHRLAS